jgi:hypothetical protein
MDIGQRELSEEVREEHAGPGAGEPGPGDARGQAGEDQDAADVAEGYSWLNAATGKIERVAKASCKALVKKNCSKCYGRGYLGHNVTSGRVISCKCVRVLALTVDTKTQVEMVKTWKNAKYQIDWVKCESEA